MYTYQPLQNFYTVCHKTRMENLMDGLMTQNSTRVLFFQCSFLERQESKRQRKMSLWGHYNISWTSLSAHYCFCLLHILYNQTTSSSKYFSLACWVGRLCSTEVSLKSINTHWYNLHCTMSSLVHILITILSKCYINRIYIFLNCNICKDTHQRLCAVNISTPW